jgi:hypothetical protein
MKKSNSARSILGSAILVWGLTGNYLLDSCSAQDLPADLISTSSDSAPAASALPPDVAANSPLAQVIRLAQAGMEQSVILTYISNSAGPFNLDADKIIYLNDLGVPTEIINAMLQRDQELQPPGAAADVPATQPADATETPAPPPAEVTVNYFYDNLAPYGGWVNVAGYGWCWRPTVVVSNPAWQPYCDDGHWVYTDSGWYWISGYSWGWATFHYGRWFQMPRYGWCWWPDTIWAPSWVSWRHDRDYCGWAPLPPYAAYKPGVGFVYQGHNVSAGFDFGLGANAFVFVSTRDFCDPSPWRHRVAAGEVTRVYNQTTILNNIDFDSHHQGLVNAGIPPHDITAVTRQEIHPITIHDGDGGIGRGSRSEQLERDGRTLIVNRPHFVGTPVLSSHSGTVPGAEPSPNEFRPNVHENENIQPPHQDVNPGSHPNFNQTQPRVPQTGQPDALRDAPAHPQEHNNSITAPLGNHSTWPGQNQTPNHNYGFDSKVLAPKTQGSDQPPPHNPTYNPQPHGNTTVPQSFSSPHIVNQYSPPATPSQSDSRSSPNGSHDSDQHSNRSGSSPSEVPSHASSQSSSSQSNRPGQDRGNNQGWH